MPFSSSEMVILSIHLSLIVQERQRKRQLGVENVNLPVFSLPFPTGEPPPTPPTFLYKKKKKGPQKKKKNKKKSWWSQKFLVLFEAEEKGWAFEQGPLRQTHWAPRASSWRVLFVPDRLHGSITKQTTCWITKKRTCFLVYPSSDWI